MGGHSSKGLFPGVSENIKNSGKAFLTANNSIKECDDFIAVKTDEKTTREHLLGEALSEETRGIIKELYRFGAEVGDGGTADAIREQMRNGKLVGGRDHVQKGRERLRQIEKLLKRNPSHIDRILLEKLRDDLRDALGDAK